MTNAAYEGLSKEGTGETDTQERARGSGFVPSWFPQCPAPVSVERSADPAAAPAVAWVTV